MDGCCGPYDQPEVAVSTLNRGTTAEPDVDAVSEGLTANRFVSHAVADDLLNEVLVQFGILHENAHMGAQLRT